MQAQDSTHPTGVSGTERLKNTDPGNSLVRARQRKANAAIQMALAGASWSEIALALGYPTARQARVAVEKALEKNFTEDDRAKMRVMAGARLERLLRGVWPKAIDPDHPDQLLAVTKAREVVADHRKLYGLDAPTEVVVHTPTQNELEEWVAKVIAVRGEVYESFDIIDGEVIEEPDALSS